MRGTRIVTNPRGYKLVGGGMQNPEFRVDLGLQRHDAETVLEEMAGQISASWRDCLVAQGVTDQVIVKFEGCFSGVANPSRPARLWRQSE